MARPKVYHSVEEKREARKKQTVSLSDMPQDLGLRLTPVASERSRAPSEKEDKN